jgi:hypothetical protein
MDTTNPIETVIPFLMKVDSPLLAAATVIEEKSKALVRLETEVAKRRQELILARKFLHEQVYKDYVDSEVETADVMCTRSRPSKN